MEISQIEHLPPAKSKAGTLEQRTSQKLRELDRSDTEKCHSDADQIVADFLSLVGFHELSEAYEDIPKWYA